MVTKQNAHKKADLDSGWDVEKSLDHLGADYTGGISSLNKKWSQEMNTIKKLFSLHFKEQSIGMYGEKVGYLKLP